MRCPECPVLGFDQVQLPPVIVGSRQGDEGERGAQFEHLAHVGKLQREGAGEADHHPMAVRTLLDQPVAGEADEELAHGRGADADLAGEFGLVDLAADSDPAVRYPFHETALDEFGRRPGLVFREIVRPMRLPQHDLAAPVPVDEAGLRHLPQDCAHRRPAHLERFRHLGLRRQPIAMPEPIERAVVGLLEECVLLHHRLASSLGRGGGAFRGHVRQACVRTCKSVFYR